MSSSRPAAAPDRGRMWLRWALLTVVVVALAVTFFNLGEWQLDRLEQRRARNTTVAEHESSQVLPYSSVMTTTITDNDQWQRVRVTGTFDVGRQLLVRYRSNGGTTGWEAVVPLRADDGRTVLVDRGFVERPAGQDFPAALPPPPTGTVHVVGHVRRNEQGKDTATVPQGSSIRLINSVQIGRWLGEPLVDGYISLLEVAPAQQGGFQFVQPPDLGEGPHLSYAMQWFAFTAIAGFGLVVLIRNDINDRKRAEARAARAAAAYTKG